MSPNGHDPEVLAAQLDGDVPLLLLPLRLEVRFRERELLVRAFPDAAAVDTLERGLTEEELAAGRAFWEAFEVAADDPARRAAWARIVALAGPRRGAWIARRTRDGGDGVPLVPSSWSRAPLSHVMPDRLVFMAMIGSSVAHRVVGEPIPDPLAVGPDPSSAGTGGDAVVDPAIRWIVDFEEAVRVGMGARVALTADEAVRGFDRVVALGVRFAGGVEDSLRRLEELLEAHRHGSGLALLRTGTPTNTTSATVAARTPQQDVEESFALEFGMPSFEPTEAELERRDGQWLADALGVRPELLARVDGAGATEMREARLMNRALWPATLGYYLEQMMRPLVSLERADEARGFLDRWVTARGPLPPVRIGGQPYGVVPVTAFSRLAWSDAAGFEPALQRVLRRAHDAWSDLTDRVPRVVDGGGEQSLLEVLASAPSATSVMRRPGLGRGFLSNLVRMTGGASAGQAWTAAAEATAESLLGDLDLEGRPKPRILEMAFRRARTRLRPLVAPDPLSEQAPLGPAAADGANYLDWLARSDIETLRREDLGTGQGGGPLPRPVALLYSLLRQSLLLAYWDAAMRVHVAEGKLQLAARAETELVDVLDRAEETRWDHLVLAAARSGGAPIGPWLDTAAGRAAREAAQLEETREAIAAIASLPTARLDRLLAEHLDLCAHRVDAWEAGFARQRLAELRSTRATGSYLGAYGWLEGVRPAPPAAAVPRDEAPEAFELPGVERLVRQPGNGGFVHAPSLAQAATAAVLRNGALTHADDGALAVELPSERARRAAGYLEGMRYEQSLEAMLGQRFERALHERSSGRPLDRFVLEFRHAFPFSAGRVVGAEAASLAPELAAGALVDGAALARAARERGYPYGVEGLPPRDSADGRGVEAAVADLLEDADAVADLVLAEAVHQSLGGNFERAAAVLRVVSEGAPAPEPEVLRSPRGGTSVTHRVGILVDQAGGARAWEGVPAGPRSAAEPRLDAWLGERLGPPGTIRCRVLVGARGEPRELTPRELGLRPLDIVLLLGGAREGLAELDRLVRAVVTEREGVPSGVALDVRLVERDADWDRDVRTFVELVPLVTALGEALAAGRPLAPRDLRPVGTDAGDPAFGFDLDELEARAAAVVDALGEARTELRASATAAESGEPAALARLRRALVRAWRFGVPDALPGDDAELVAQAAATGDELDRRAGLATAALEGAGGAADGPRIRALSGAFADALGAQLRVLPRFRPDPPGLREVLAAGGGLLAGTAPLALEGWLEASGRVRRPVGALVEARTLAGVLGDEPPELGVAQLPRREGERWVALAPPEGEAASASVSIVLDGPRSEIADGPVAGLIVDEWVEVVPAATQLTGITFHHDASGAEPPQALLLVVPPVRSGRWSWQDVVDGVLETLDLAKVRAVDPDLVAQTAFAQLLPAAVVAASPEPVSIVTDLRALAATGGVAERPGGGS